MNRKKNIKITMIYLRVLKILFGMKLMKNKSFWVRREVRVRLAREWNSRVGESNNNNKNKKAVTQDTSWVAPA